MRRCLTVLGGALAALAAVPVTVLAALSASTADLAFAPLTYSHTQQVSSGILTLTATDTGTGGFGLTNGGWNVTILASSFAYSGPHDASAIPAANLTVTAAHPPSRVSGQDISPIGGPRTTGQTGALDVARKVLQADESTGAVIRTYYGIGTYQQAIDVSLVVPPQAAPGTYTSTLTVTMSTGP